MNVETDIATLRGEIEKTLEVLDRLDAHYRTFLETDFKLLGEKNSSAIVIAELLTDFYTCLETLFLRIAQFFENSLSRDQWHKDLLHKMTIDIPDTRGRVISDSMFVLLSEFLKFRHFRRYYFEFEYDWDKIRYLQKKYEQAQPLIRQDLTTFQGFLIEIGKAPEEPAVPAG